MPAAQKLPSYLVGIIISLCSCSRYYCHGISRIILIQMLFYLMVKYFEVSKKLIAPVLITNAKIVKAKWLFMAHLFPNICPFIVFKVSTYSKINKICKISYILISKLATCRIYIIASGLTQNSAGHNRKRLSAQVFCHLKIFHIAKSHGHVVTPDIDILFSYSNISNRILPVIDIVPGV